MPHRNITLLYWFNFFTDFRLYAPIAIIYFTKVTGSYALGMSIFSIIFVTSAIFEIPTGILSDYVGRKKTVMFGAITAVIYSILYALSGSFLILALGAMFEGLSRAFYSGNNEALLYDSLQEVHEEEKYDEYLGKVSSMFQVALAISGVIGGLLASWSFALIMWISVISQIICLYLSTQLREPKNLSSKTGNIYKHIEEAMRGFMTKKKLRLLSISSIISFGIGEASYQFQSAFYNSLWPIWAVGVAKTLSNIGATISFRYSGAINRKFGTIKVLLLSSIFRKSINIIAVSIPTFFSPILMATTSLTYGVTTVAERALMQREFTYHQRATMGSLNAFAWSIFFGIVAFCMGKVADIISPAYALLIFMILSIPTIWIYFLLYRDDKDCKKMNESSS